MSGHSMSQSSPAPFYSTGSTHKFGGSSGSSASRSHGNTGSSVPDGKGLSLQDRRAKWYPDKEYLINEELGNRNHRARNPGGFLLQPPSAPISPHNAARISVQKGNENIKGKNKTEHGDLALPKRRKARQRPQSRTAVGSSPLSIELFNAAPALADGSDGGSSREETHLVPSRTSNSSQRTADSNTASDSNHVPAQYEPRQGATSGLGDPAEIVNLALNLSESRRRTLSTSRSLPMGPVSNRRLPSLNQHCSLSTSGIPGALASGGSLRQYMQQQRQASRNVSPKSNRRRDRDISFPPSPRKPNTPTPLITASEFDIDVADEVMLKFSDATLARAEKAKVTLELCYEYRRLLNHLPALPRPSKNKSTSNWSVTQTNIETAQGIGREYNPLQYIRNRKVRVWERNVLDAEGDGWKNLDRVRNWVDTVAHEAEACPLTLGDSLPPFEVPYTGLISDHPSSEIILSNSTGSSTNQSRRSKLDWSITPWDLFADAYWLHQNENVKNIEDPSGGKIFNKDIIHETAPRTSWESTRSSTRRSKSITRQYMTPEKPSSLIASSRNGSRDRGRQHMHEPHTPISNDNGSRDRRRLWPRALIRSRSSSGSNESLDGEGLHNSDLFAPRHQPDSTVLVKQLRELVKKEAETEKLNIEKTKKDESSILELNQAHPLEALTRNENPAPSDTLQMEGLRHIRSHSEQIPEPSKPSRHEKSSRHSLDESVAAISKNSSIHDFASGQVFNSSPLSSRPATPKLSLPPGLGSFKPIKDEEAQAINSEDLRPRSKRDTNSAPQDSNGTKSQDTPYRERIATFGNVLLSPMTAEAIGRKFKRAEELSTRSTRDTNETDSRFRGFFKGARIAELVGNEVHKVGGRLRKKEKQNELSQPSSTLANYASEESDAEAHMSGAESGPEEGHRRSITDNDESASLSQKSTAIDRPRYHMGHLPTFRSPFSKEEQSSDMYKGFSNDDHITRQQMAQRAHGRPSRFDRLAPPKIDIEGISPSSSPPMTRTHTRDTEVSYDESRRSSGSQSDIQLHDADMRSRGVLGIPGTIIGETPVSPLSGLESHLRHPSERKNPLGERQWSISDRASSPARGMVTKREIARARALLLSSGVKANEIIRREQEVREVPSELLQQLQIISNRPLPAVPCSQEHILAARMLMSNIETSNRQLKEAAENFSHTTAEILHDQIRALDEHVTYRLTPAVRAAADDADDFSTELTTTHTLAMKQLDDSLNILLRRRRRRFRWVRRGGYLLLEWTLVGIMWFLWFIAVIVRIVRCTIGGGLVGLIRVFRWFFWM